MFVTTFYSYKGGVGRTLALANVAVAFARRGKKVLVVDFDLEAPGLQTMDAFRSSSGKLGVIDFIQRYVEEGSIPQSKDYIHGCKVYLPTSDEVEIEQFAEQPAFTVDIMPAGGDDETYANRFAAVDWNRLYNEQDGFLVMEELRNQWALAGYDYVLIDSRTGHTDVGGICTRQLPDAVVAVFFPNEQNLVGLAQVVESIRASRAREHPIDLIFVASRVPRLDDEHGHLRHWLEQAKNRLKYDRGDFVTIEQYDSLMLLNQALFVLARPKSGLASQYGSLELQIAKQNSEDAVGALAYAREAARNASPRGTSLASGPRPEAEQMLLRLRDIQKLHESDAFLQYTLARAFYQKQSLFDAAVASDLALAYGSSPGDSSQLSPGFIATVNRLRLRIFSALDDTADLNDSALSILGDANATEEAVLDAMLALAAGEPKLLPVPEDIPALATADPERLIAIALRLAASPPAAVTAASIAARAIAEGASSKLADEVERNNLQLALIAGGRFDLARDAAASDDDEIPERFNWAMADWGFNRSPNLETFSALLKEIGSLGPSIASANLYQCGALAAAVVGEQDLVESNTAIAKRLISGQARREFSCWSYFNVQPREFEQHLTEIKTYAKGGPAPDVLQRAWARSPHVA